MQLHELRGACPHQRLIKLLQQFSGSMCEFVFLGGFFECYFDLISCVFLDLVFVIGRIKHKVTLGNVRVLQYFLCSYSLSGENGSLCGALCYSFFHMALLAFKPRPYLLLFSF